MLSIFQDLLYKFWIFSRMCLLADAKILNISQDLTTHANANHAGSAV